MLGTPEAGRHFPDGEESTIDRAKREIGSQRRSLPGERRLNLDSQAGRAEDRRSCELVVAGEEVLVTLKSSQSVASLTLGELSERQRKPPTLRSTSRVGDHRPQLRTPPVWSLGEPSYEGLGELTVEHVPKYAATSRRSVGTATPQGGFLHPWRPGGTVTFGRSPAPGSRRSSTERRRRHQRRGT